MKIFSGEYTGNLIDNEGNKPSNLDEIDYSSLIGDTIDYYSDEDLISHMEITFNPDAEFSVTIDVSEDRLKDFLGEDVITDDIARICLNDTFILNEIYDSVIYALTNSSGVDYENITMPNMVDFFVEDKKETTSESIENAVITDVETFIKEAKQKFPGSDAYYDGDTNSIVVMLSE